MKLKRFTRAFLTAIVIFACTTVCVKAVDTWKFYQDVIITDTSGTDRTNLTAMTGILGTNLYSAGYIAADGLDTRVKDNDNTTELEYMIDTTQINVFLNTLNAYQSRTIRLYYGYAPAQTSFPIVLGNGYITTADDAALEPGGSFTLEVNGYFRGTIGSIVQKGNRITIQRTAATTVKVGVNGAFVLTATGQSEGVHDYIVTLSGGTLSLYDGVTLLDSAASASPTDTADNWEWDVLNGAPYINYAKLTVGGVLKLWYEPNTMVVGTTVEDRQNNYDGTISWGTNSNLDVSVGAITAYNAAGTGGSTSAPANAGSITQPDNWYASGTASTSLPFYDTFNTTATNIGWSTQTLYVWAALIIAIGLGVFAMVLTGSGLIAAIVCGIVIAAGVSATVLSAWMLFTYIIIGGGLMFLSRQV